eukprot:4047720-Ditylum_brightwellii.AAC.1
MAGKSSSVLVKEKKEVLDQQDRPKVCIDCNVACNVLIACCECIKEKCKDCAHFCTLCEEVWGCYTCDSNDNGWYCAKCCKSTMVLDEMREMQGED